MTRQEILKFIKGLEEKFPVENWQLGDVQLWPFIRLQIGYKLIDCFDSLKKKESKNISHDNNAKIKSAGFKGYFFFLQQVLRFLKYKGRTQFLFIGANSHRVKIRGSYLNKFFHPLYDHLKSRGISFYHFEYGEEAIPIAEFPYSKRASYLDTIFNFLDKLINKKILKIKIEADQLNLEQYQDFLHYIKKELKVDNSFFLFFEESNIVNLAKRWYRQDQYFIWLLSRLNPKYIIELCFYDPVVMCLNSAAHKLGINTIEIMHGVPSNIHIGYSNWVIKSKSGYSALPEQFWCWTEEDTRPIRQWADLTDYHKVVVGGHPWMEYFREKSNKDTDRSNNMIRILYSFQPIGELLDSWIIEAIKNSKNQYEWWLRLHPRQMHMMDDLLALLTRHGLNERTVVKKASQDPLPDVISMVRLHITKFSGVSVEASMSGIKTILIDPKGLASYPGLIEMGMAKYLDSTDPDSLLDCIEKILEEDLHPEKKNNEILYHKILDKLIDPTN